MIAFLVRTPLNNLVEWWGAMKNSLSTLIKIKEITLSELIISRSLIEVEIDSIEQKIESINKQISFHIKDIEDSLQKSGLNLSLISFLNYEIKMLEQSKDQLLMDIKPLQEKINNITQRLKFTNIDKKKYEKLDAKHKLRQSLEVENKTKREVEDIISTVLGGEYAS